MNLPSYHIIKWQIPDTSKSIEQIEPIKIYTGPSTNSISVGEFFPGESIQIDKVFKTNYNEKWVSYIGLQGKRRYILLPNNKERYVVFPPFEDDNADNKDIEMIEEFKSVALETRKLHEKYGISDYVNSHVLDTLQSIEDILKNNNAEEGNS